MLVAIAWRNLWRNTRRTMITVLAVAGGLASMLAMAAMMRAMGDRILEGLTGSFMGHVQIHREGYRTKRGSTRTVTDAELVLTATRGVEGVVGASGRIFGFAHASMVRGSDEEVRAGGGEDVSSPVVAILGIDPEDESAVTDLSEKVTKGRWFEGEAEVVVGAGLAKRHSLELGDAFLPTAVDMSGAMRGPWAVSEQVPRVVGIMRSGIEDLDGRMILMPRTYLAKLIRMEDQVHEVAIRAADPEGLDPLVANIREAVAKARASRDERVSHLATRPLRVARQGGAEPASGDAGPAADGGAGPLPTVRLVGVEAGEGAESAEGLEGRYLENSEDIVLSQRLATALGVAPGDRVDVSVPIDCGEGIAEEDCPPSAEPFVVAGVVAEEGLLDGAFGLVAAQVMRGNIAALAPSAVSALGQDDAAAVGSFVERLRGEVAAPDEVLPWYEIAPDMHEMVAMMDVAPFIFFIIIYFAVMLGIVNTMLMATFERTRELGLMRALGMRSGKVVAMVMWESTLLAVVGIAAGLAVGMPIVWYWIEYGMNMGVFMGDEASFDISGVSFDPVLWPSITVGDVLNAVVAVGVMTSLSGLWPAFRASRLQPTEALRHE